MPISAFRRILKTQKKQSNFSGFYLLLGASLLISLLNFWDLSQPKPLNLETQFAFSLPHLKDFKLWTLLTHSFFHSNPYELLFSCVSILFFLQTLKQFYSGRELSRFFILASVAEGIGHALLGPETQMISGSLGIVITFLLLYVPLAPLTGNRNLFQVRHFPQLGRIPMNLPLLSLLLICFDLFTLGSSWRPDHSSFAGHIGILTFVWIQFRKTLPSSLYSNNFNLQTVDNPAFTKGMEDWMPSIPVTPVTPGAPKHPATPPASFERQIDLILEKISQKGIDSLSDKERGILDKASKSKKSPRSHNG